MKTNETTDHPVTWPTAPRRRHTWHRPTGDVDDEYAWMLDVENPEFISYLGDENEAAEAWFAPHAGTVDAIYDEIKSRVRETDMSTPVRSGPFWYVTTTEEGKSYPIHRRGPDRESADSMIVLDENVAAEGHEYFDLGALDVTMDHTHVAWSTDTAGDEHYLLRIRDLTTGVDLDDELHDIAHAGTAWSRDGQWLFYVTADEQERPSRVWRHRVGRPQSEDECIHEEVDERFYVAIGTTRSDEFVVIHSASKTSSEVRLLRTDTPTAQPTVVIERRDDVEYSIDHWGDVLLLHTNVDGAVDFTVLEAPVDADHQDPASWSVLVPHLAGRRITGCEAFADHLIVHEWADAQPRLRLIFRDRTERTIEIGDDPHDIEPSNNPEWSSPVVRFVTQSLSTPARLFEENAATGDRTLLRQIPTPNVDLEAYRSERRWATSADGTRVPVDIVAHVDTCFDGTAPGIVYGYGAYEASLAPWFSVARLSLLDRGFVWALAHPRGGGELGRRWYLDGKLEHKQHTFDDVIACAEHLVDAGVVASGRLGLRGGSAGGLLVGACVTQRPDLFASAVAEVPFVDIVSTMSDPNLPLTVTEWEEWGDPRSEPFASVIEAYSPYDNTVSSTYPALYVTAGLNDPRVSVHEPAKWVARLRSVARGGRPIVFKVEMGAGHGGPTGRYDAWRDEARTLAFQLATT